MVRTRAHLSCNAAARAAEKAFVVQLCAQVAEAQKQAAPPPAEATLAGPIIHSTSSHPSSTSRVDIREFLPTMFDLVLSTIVVIPQISGYFTFHLISIRIMFFL